MKEEKQPDSKASEATVSNERGQGTIEFILVLVVIAAMALGGLYQFNDAFGKYLDNYFGNYLACLLETGELPNLGGTTNAGCDEDFEEFSLANGRPPKDLGSGVAPKPSGGSGNAAAGNQQVIRGGGKFGRGNRRNRVAARAADGGNAAKKAAKGKGESGSESSFTSRRNSDLYNYGNNGKRQKRVPAKTVAGVKDKKKKEQQKKPPKKKANSGGSKKRGRFLAAKELKTKEQESDAEIEFSLGKYIRYLIIAGIIIAIVIFIGGQALQLSKEWD